MNRWYGYSHVDGEIHVKRYFDRRDIEEARESIFVDAVTGPFDAEDRDSAFIEAGIRLFD